MNIVYHEIKLDRSNLMIIYNMLCTNIDTANADSPPGSKCENGQNQIMYCKDCNDYEMCPSTLQLIYSEQKKVSQL